LTVGTIESDVAVRGRRTTIGQRRRIERRKRAARTSQSTGIKFRERSAIIARTSRRIATSRRTFLAEAEASHLHEVRNRDFMTAGIKVIIEADLFIELVKDD